MRVCSLSGEHVRVPTRLPRNPGRYRTNSHSGFPKGSYLIPNPTHFHVVRYYQTTNPARPKLTNLKKVNANSEANTDFNMNLSEDLYLTRASQTSFIRYTHVCHCIHGECTSCCSESSCDEMDTKNSEYEAAIMQKVHENIVSDVSLESSGDEITLYDQIVSNGICIGQNFDDVPNCKQVIEPESVCSFVCNGITVKQFIDDTLNGKQVAKSQLACELNSDDASNDFQSSESASVCSSEKFVTPAKQNSSSLELLTSFMKDKSKSGNELLWFAITKTPETGRKHDKTLQEIVYSNAEQNLPSNDKMLLPASDDATFSVSYIPDNDHSEALCGESVHNTSCDSEESWLGYNTAKF